ncbi:MAG: 2-isopropylmalate synthase, partial [Nanoarchaeota archaeon]|nr:2-isopropylmalate synthase [Nanoarchaeota archaeon]
MQLVDSTLREGEQTPHVCFSIQEKVRIARMLDKIGIEMIEAGDPSVSLDLFEAVKKIASLGLRAEVQAHSLATKECIDRVKKTGAARVIVLYPTSKIHLDSKVQKTQGEALKIISENIIYARSLGLKVRYTPEDATRTDFKFLVKACNTAIAAGADRINIADTLGIMQP